MSLLNASLRTLLTQISFLNIFLSPDSSLYTFINIRFSVKKYVLSFFADVRFINDFQITYNIRLHKITSNHFCPWTFFYYIYYNILLYFWHLCCYHFTKHLFFHRSVISICPGNYSEFGNSFLIACFLSLLILFVLSP